MTHIAPIGIFDSGIGGLPILYRVQKNLPKENFLYFADSAYAPYGDRPEQEISERALVVAKFLKQQGIKALVVACNTATVVAIKTIRSTYQDLPIIGIEPGLEQAAVQSHSKIVGVLATKATLKSARMISLKEKISFMNGVHFKLQACVGLADQVEKGELYSTKTTLLLRQYIVPIIKQGADTLVLGCTHYSFLRPLIGKVLDNLTSRVISIVDIEGVVIQQLIDILSSRNLLRTNTAMSSGQVQAFTSGNQDYLNYLKKIFSSFMQVSSPNLIKDTQSCFCQGMN